MKAKILSLFLALLTFAACNNDDESVKPTLAQEPAAEIPVGTAQSDDLTIEGKITEKTADGYKAEGTLLVESGDQKAEIVSGAFTVVTDDTGELLSIEGTGVAQMPAMGHFESFVPEAAKESSFVYNTGKYFKGLKDEFKALPLRDTSYYFFFNILNLMPGETVDWKIKNAGLGMTSFFINLPFEEVIVPTGSLSFELPSGTTKVGDDLVIGISGKGSFPFSPTVYGDSALNAVITEKKAFSELNGMLYLSGEMAFTRNMPYNLAGSIVVDADFDDLFENGLSGSESDIAMNGKLLFGHDLIDLLPVDLETELVNVTLRIKGKGIGAGANAEGSVAFAGEFDDDAWVGTLLEELAGKTVADNFPRSGNEGSMFVSFGDDPDDFGMYVRAEFGMKIPGIGERELRKGIFYITSDEIQVSGGLGLPFIPGNLYASGLIGFDGKIHLTGSAIGDLEINDDLKFYSNLTVDIYNDSVTLKGDIEVPYEIGKVDIKGNIGSDGLAFHGKVDTKFNYGNINLPLTNLEIKGANKAVTLKGSLLLNPQFPVAKVAGKISASEFYLQGTLNLSKMALGQGQDRAEIPLLGMEFMASSKSGVRFNGRVNIPYGIAMARVVGQMTSNKDAYGFPEISLLADFASNPTIAFGGLSFPTASFSMMLSTVTGVQFRGKIAIPGGFGAATADGRIGASGLSFNGRLGSHVGLGQIAMKANMTVAVSSAGVKVGGFGKPTYPIVVDGEVFTPVGITLDVVGVVDWNGIPATYGNLSVQQDIGPLKPRGTLQFEFGGSIGIYFYGEVCVAALGAEECVDKTFTLTTNWDGITNEELCFIKCISIMDIYNAVK